MKSTCHAGAFFFPQSLSYFLFNGIIFIMKLILFFLLQALLVASLYAFDKAPNVRDLLSDIHSQPSLITETIYTLSDENGKITEHPTLRKNIKHYNWTGRTLSVIRYNDAGKPYAYEKLTFTSDGLLSTSTLQTKGSTSVTSYEYTEDYSGYTQYVSVDGGEKIKKQSFELGKEDGEYVSYEYSYASDGSIAKAKKTLHYAYSGDLRKDVLSMAENPDSVYYYHYTDGKISSIVVEKDSATRQRKVYYRNNKRYMEESFELNENGDCVKETSADSIYVYKYTYDSKGNWTQKDSFFENKNDDFKYDHPLLRTKRDIQYDPAATPAVPAEFFSFDAENDEIREEVLAADELGSDKPFTSIKTDPIDDKKVLYIVFNAPQRVNDYVDNVTLVIKKKEGSKPELYVNWKEFLNERSCYVTYRIDDDKAKTEEWLLSTDEKASFYNGDIAALLDKLRNASQFIVRTTPFNEPPCTAIFDVSALRNLDRQYLWLYNRDYKNSGQ